jgi:hypothetical protein
LASADLGARRRHRDDGLDPLHRIIRRFREHLELLAKPSHDVKLDESNVSEACCCGDF